MLKKSLWVVGLFLGFFNNASSKVTEKDTLKLYYLDEVVVTATRTERAVKDISATVSIVDRE